MQIAGLLHLYGVWTTTCDINNGHNLFSDFQGWSQHGLWCPYQWKGVRLNNNLVSSHKGHYSVITVAHNYFWRQKLDTSSQFFFSSFLLQLWFILPVAVSVTVSFLFLVFAPLLIAPIGPLAALAFLLLGVPVYFLLAMDSPWKIRPKTIDKLSSKVFNE